MNHRPYSWYMSWAALISAFFESMLQMAVIGHIIIASARMAGFRLLRNTYRPLSSPNIAAFWNRYYFYFKELLVEFYYYPTFLRCFKQHLRVRLLFATFMAAGFGNAFYHFIRDIDYVATVRTRSITLRHFGEFGGHRPMRRINANPTTAVIRRVPRSCASWPNPNLSRIANHRNAHTMYTKRKLDHLTALFIAFPPRSSNYRKLLQLTTDLVSLCLKCQRMRSPSVRTKAP